jgi:hypothetical protein
MMRKLQIAQIVEFMEECRRFWKECVDRRMDCDGIPDKIQKRENVWKDFRNYGRILFYNNRSCWTSAAKNDYDNGFAYWEYFYRPDMYSYYIVLYQFEVNNDLLEENAKLTALSYFWYGFLMGLSFVAFVLA